MKEKPIGTVKDRIHARLQELKHHIENGEPLDPQARVRLASLVMAIDNDLRQNDLSPDQLAHVAAALDPVGASFQQPHNAGLLGTARRGLEQAAARLEAEAPTATRMVEQLIEILANLGI